MSWKGSKRFAENALWTSWHGIKYISSVNQYKTNEKWNTQIGSHGPLLEQAIQIASQDHLLKQAGISSDGY